MRARLLQIFVFLLFSTIVGACSKGASEASKLDPEPTPIPAPPNQTACVWGTSNWGGCTWQ